MGLLAQMVHLEFQALLVLQVLQARAQQVPPGLSVCQELLARMVPRVLQEQQVPRV